MEVIIGIEAQVVVKALLVVFVAALHLAVVPWSIWFDELMPDTQLSSGGLEQCEKVPFAVGEAISELKAIVGLDTLHLNTPADIPFTSRLRKSAEKLDTLARIGHLLVGLELIFLLFLTGRKQPQLLHNSVQALGAPAIASLLQTPLELNQTQARIPAAHIPE